MIIRMTSTGTPAPEAGSVAPERVSRGESARLGLVGRGLLERAATGRDILSKPPESLGSSAERKLQLVEAFRTGQLPGSGDSLEKANLTGGKLLSLAKDYSVKRDDGTTVDGLCIAGISAKNQDDEGAWDGTYKVYFAKVQTDGKAGDLIYDGDGETLLSGDVSKETLMDLQAANESADLATLFDGDNGKVFNAYADARREGDAMYVPPKDLGPLIEKVAQDGGISLIAPIKDIRRDETAQAVDVFIANQITTLRAEMQELAKNAGSEARIRRLNDTLRDLQIAALAKGPGGVLYRTDALAKLRPLLEDNALEATTSGNTQRVGTMEKHMEAIDHHVDTLSPQRDGAKNELMDMLDASDLPNKEELIQAVENNEAVSVLTNESVMSLGGISRFLFGRDNFDAQSLAHLVNDPSISESTRFSLSDALKKGPIDGVGLLAILLGIPVALALAIAQGATGMMAKQR